MQRIRQGDDVIVLVGKDKGRRGKVDRVVGDRVFVDGVNLVKKHVKGNPQGGRPGRHPGEGGLGPRLERRAVQPRDEEGWADRLPHERRRPEGAILPGRRQRSERLRNMARLKQDYRDRIVPEMMKEHAYKSVMQVPRIEKITLNMGLGEAVGDKKILENAVGDMIAIGGQKPVVTVARKSIAGFKIRDGYPIGAKVTLRRDRMYEFLDRLVAIAIPRIRDFRGISPRSFDGRGNYSLGVKEQIIFPEIDYDKIDAMRGMDITITTSAQTDAEALSLLKKFNFPFRQPQQQGA